MTTQNNLQYVGSELELFTHAINWRSYWSSKIIKHLRGHVLEVGAGIGTNTKNLYLLSDSWTALEPDAKQSATISNWLYVSNVLSANVFNGPLSSLGEDKMYDAILYVDVLEHIEDDQQEVINAYKHLAPGGVIAILAPAHDFLYSPFDKSIGHYRRYSKKALLKLRPSDSAIKFTGYLDSVGLLASLGNKLFLKSSMPTKSQILFWDTVLVPASKLLDGVLRFKIGKSILAIWQKPL
jgi:SAM-dependent methyltransferase